VDVHREATERVVGAPPLATTQRRGRSHVRVWTTPREMLEEEARGNRRHTVRIADTYIVVTIVAPRDRNYSEGCDRSPT
jgi:hypothetical protein